MRQHKHAGGEVANNEVHKGVLVDSPDVVDNELPRTLWHSYLITLVQRGHITTWVMVKRAYRRVFVREQVVVLGSVTTPADGWSSGSDTTPADGGSGGSSTTPSDGGLGTMPARGKIVNVFSHIIFITYDALVGNQGLIRT